MLAIGDSAIGLETMTAVQDAFGLAATLGIAPGSRANRKEPNYFLLGTVGELGARVD